MAGSSLSRWMVLIGLAYAGVVLSQMPDYTVDDAFISFRYAENLAEHGQLTWNVGEDPVEGYTGVALILILAGAFKLGIDPVLASRIVGISSFMLGAWLIVVALKMLNVRPIYRSAACILYLASPIMFMHAISGLETTLFSAILLGSGVLLLACLQDQTRSLRKISCLFALLLVAGLVRPEGAVLAVTVVPALSIFYWRQLRKPLSPIMWRFAIVYVLPGTMYFLTRWWYYGRLLPNVYYAKSLDGLNHFHQFGQLKQFFRNYLLSLAILAAWRIVVDFRSVRKGIVATRHQPEAASYLYAGLSMATAVTLLTLQYLRTDLVMNYAYRYYSHFLPVGIVLLFAVAGSGVRRMTRDGLRRRWVCMATTALVIVLCYDQARRFRWTFIPQVTFMDANAHLAADEHRPAGKLINQIVPPNEWLTVHIDAGAIPYFSKLRTVDFGKLNDEYLASHDDTPERRVAYFYSINPGVAVFTSWWMRELHPDQNGMAILGDPRFDEQYKLITTFRSLTTPNYWQAVFVRKDLYLSAVRKMPRIGALTDSPAYASVDPRPGD